MDHFVFRRVINQIEKNRDSDLHLNYPSHNQLDVDFLSIISKDLNDLDEQDNTFEDDNSRSFLTSFPCYNNFNYKTGLSFVLHCGNGLIDTADNLVKTKIKWAKNLKLLKPKNEARVVKELQAVKKCLYRKDVTDMKIYDQEFLDQFLKEPEPSFKGSYNWLYTGGCISSIQHEGSMFLCCSDTICNSPVVKFLKLNEDCTSVNEEQIFCLRTDDPVLQISLKNMTEDVIIGIRQKTRCTILSALHGRGNVIRKWKKSVSADSIYTSFDISPSCEKVAVTNADMSNRFIKIHSIETDQSHYKYQNKIRTAKDSWNKILFKENDVIFADRTNFCIIDQRESDKFALKYSPLERNEFECDLICNMLISESDPNSIYLATTHTLMQLDVRFPKPIQKWTHLMKHCPQHGIVTVDTNNELVLLQGNSLEDFVGIENAHIQENDNFHMLSKTTPYLLKSMKNTIRIAHYNGVCLNPIISKRFDCTITGSCVIKDESNTSHYFVTNAFGDVYGCKIKQKDDDECDDLGKMLDKMKIYEAHFLDSNPGQKFDFHEIKDLNHIFEKVEELGLTKDAEIKSKFPHSQWKHQKTYAPERLKLYKDYLAKKVNVVWGISNFNDETEESENEQVAVADKVKRWLQQTE